jgi:flagellar biosynthesis protein FlhB
MNAPFKAVSGVDCSNPHRRLVMHKTGHAAGSREPTMLVVLMLGAALLSLIIEVGVQHVQDAYALHSAPLAKD